MKIKQDNIRTLQCAKQFTEHTGRVNSIDYSSDGMHMISSSDDESILIYNCSDGTKHRSLNSKKYGVDLIHFAHNINDAIHCSTKVDDTIRYLSLHDNKYIRYFTGHTKKVTTLSMSPVDDTFLSASMDKTIRLWDLRSPNCQGIMTLAHKAISAFDPDGLIFAAGVNSEKIMLYDIRAYDKGPFATFGEGVLEKERHCEWTSMRFSPNGKSILLSTNGEVLRVVDSFSGQVAHTLSGHKNAKHLDLHASFSPCSHYIFCGGSDANIHCWSADTGDVVHVINTTHTPFLQHVSFNPRFYMMASACQNVFFWVPAEDE